jgi:hypothetical protein
MSHRPTPEQKEILNKLKLRSPIYELTLIRTEGDLGPNDVPEKEGRLTNRFTDTHEEVSLATIKDMLEKGLIVEVGPHLIAGFYSRTSNARFSVSRVHYGLPLKKYKE